MLYILPPGESPGGLFIRVVGGSGNNVQSPPNYPVYTEYKVLMALQSLCTLNYLM
jgi:hypothetical protein